MTPREEAIRLFSEVLNNLTSSQKDLKTCLRKCQLGCKLLGWNDSEEWFRRELSGYPAQTAKPDYRILRGSYVWEAQGSSYDQASWVTSSEHAMQGTDPEPAILDVWSPLDWLFRTAQFGYKEDTQQEKQVHLHLDGRSITIRRYKFIPAFVFSMVLSTIENHTFDFVSRSYVQLKYGDTLQDIWSHYRQNVDTVLRSFNLTNHLTAILEGINSDNPEAWRNAALGCRNLLNDLADALWQDPRSTYSPLPGQGPDGKLDVTKGKFANRLSAYLHHHSVAGTRGRFLREELEHLSAMIRSLISLQSEAHQPISMQDATSITVATYFIVGELAARTDLHPVTHYSDAPSDT